jgi:hypothetical protein
MIRYKSRRLRLELYHEMAKVRAIAELLVTCLKYRPTSPDHFAGCAGAMRNWVCAYLLRDMRLTMYLVSLFLG